MLGLRDRERGRREGGGRRKGRRLKKNANTLIKTDSIGRFCGAISYAFTTSRDIKYDEGLPSSLSFFNQFLFLQALALRMYSLMT